MKKITWVYISFFVLLLLVFLLVISILFPSKKASLAVINDGIPAFQLTDQNGSSFTNKETEGKVYVAEYFFTTCKAICPKMNANMRRIYNKFHDVPDFMILSHTCQPEVDSVSVLKAYEEKMLKGTLTSKTDGSYSIVYTEQDKKKTLNNTNWKFLTGDKRTLYSLARTGYKIDNQQPPSSQKIESQFIHTQFFALVDRFGRVRGIYDGLKEDEIQQLIEDIPLLMEEKVEPTRFVNGFSNTPQ